MITKTINAVIAKRLKADVAIYGFEIATAATQPRNDSIPVFCTPLRPYPPTAKNSSQAKAWILNRPAQPDAQSRPDEKDSTYIPSPPQ